MIAGTPAAQVAEVLRQYGHELVGEPRLVGQSTLNWNYRAETTGGVMFVRRHRAELGPAMIRDEHRLLRWVAQRGIPVPLPLAAHDGQTLVTLDGSWAIFPWVVGTPALRGAATPREAEALGEMHGRLHALLSTHRRSNGARSNMVWDRAASHARLKQLAQAAADQRAPGWVRDAIALQATMLADSELLPMSALDQLPAQLVHGDYHDQQVLFDDQARIVAVTDWELVQTNARVWELIRSLTFGRFFECPGLEEYLAGYRRHVTLSADECRLGLQLWWQSRLTGLWVWTAFFLEGNRRVEEFFPATVADLQKLQDQSWRSRTLERFLRAAVG